MGAGLFGSLVYGFGNKYRYQLRRIQLAFEKLPASFAGRRFDRVLLETLPAGIDPCGENGEFHSFVSGGPMLSRKVAVKTGETVERDGFAYTDLLPA